MQHNIKLVIYTKIAPMDLVGVEGVELIWIFFVEELFVSRKNAQYSSSNTLCSIGMNQRPYILGIAFIPCET